MSTPIDASQVDDPVQQETLARATLVERMLFLGQLASTETAHFHQVAAARLGLGVTDMKALSALLQEGPMTAGQLARRLSLTTGAVTNVISRLERRAFAKRLPDPQDRRKVIVAFNQEQRATTDAVYQSMGEAFRRLLETYSTEQLAFLVQYTRAAVTLTKQELMKLASSDV